MSIWSSNMQITWILCLAVRYIHLLHTRRSGLRMDEGILDDDKSFPLLSDLFRCFEPNWWFLKMEMPPYHPISIIYRNKPSIFGVPTLASVHPDSQRLRSQLAPKQTWVVGEPQTSGNRARSPARCPANLCGGHLPDPLNPRSPLN